jgi:GNAT superfamily N-acetyltransferase
MPYALDQLTRKLENSNANGLSLGKSLVGHPPRNAKDALGQLMTSAPWREIHPPQAKDGEVWMQASVSEFEDDFRAAAWHLGLYETTDFHSLNQRLHDTQVEKGHSTGAYVCRSMFNRMWAGDWQGRRVDHGDYSMTMVLRDGEVAGFYLWDRPEPDHRVRAIGQVGYGNRKYPAHTYDNECLGLVAFLVLPAFRGKLLGSRLAQVFIDQTKVWRAEHPASQTLPSIQAYDRAAKLLFNEDAPMVVSQMDHRSVNFGRALEDAFFDDLDRDERQFDVERKDFVKPKRVRVKAG